MTYKKPYVKPSSRVWLNCPVCSKDFSRSNNDYRAGLKKGLVPSCSTECARKKATGKPKKSRLVGNDRNGKIPPWGQVT